MPSTPISPKSIAAPAANYAHAVLSTDARRWLHVSGEVPIAPDGSVPDDIGAQAEAVWGNIQAILAEADMAVTDIVSMTTFVVPGQDMAAVMSVRDRVLGGHLSASTLVYVPALVRSEWKLEIAVVAAAD